MSRVLSFEKWSSVNEASFNFDPEGEYPDKTFGLPRGGSDSRKVSSGGNGGDWGGSMQRALAFAKVANDFMKKDIIASQKRSKKLTASNYVSDHYDQQNDSYAVDLACLGSEGDKLLAELMKWLESSPENTRNTRFTDYKGGSWLNFTRGGYRYQIGWRVKDHFDHIHVGVRKTGKPDTDGHLTSTSGTSSSSSSSAVDPEIKKILAQRTEKQEDDSNLTYKEKQEKEEEKFKQELEDYKVFLDAKKSSNRESRKK